jgi:HPt (histidine-containing phosphotransfer) domain-containing protein
MVHLDAIDLADEPSSDVTEEAPFKKDFLTLDEDLSQEALTEETAATPLQYDLNAVAGALGMEPAFMEELLRDYKTDALAMHSTIIQAIKAFDTHTWRSSAAKLKGISDNLRLSEISDELAILSVTNDAQEAKKASARLVNYLDQL